MEFIDCNLGVSEIRNLAIDMVNAIKNGNSNMSHEEAKRAAIAAQKSVLSRNKISNVYNSLEVSILNHLEHTI